MGWLIRVCHLAMHGRTAPAHPLQPGLPFAGFSLVTERGLGLCLLRNDLCPLFVLHSEQGTGQDAQTDCKGAWVPLFTFMVFIVMCHNTNVSAGWSEREVSQMTVPAVA